MKQWFPLTDYDFYGYIACGFVVIFGVDYCFFDSAHLLKSWTLFEASVLFSVAYVVGQIVAMPSSILLEHIFACRILKPPLHILLGTYPDRFDRKVISLLVGRNYDPFPEKLRDKIILRAAKDLKTTASDIINSPDIVFHPAFIMARKSDDLRKRIDDFRNQYGFNRNMALAGFIVAALMFQHACRFNDTDARSIGFLAVVLSVGMLLRFLKFYASFMAEVLRAYAFQTEAKK